MWDKRWQRFTMWDSCIQESLDIQPSADVFYASRMNIHLSILGRIGLPWRWRLVNEIIIKKILITRAMNSWMLIWKAGLYGDEACYSGRNPKIELESLHCMRRGKQRPPTEMLQASNWTTKLGHLGMRILIGWCHINLVEELSSWRRCCRSLSSEYLIRTELHGLHVTQMMHLIEENYFVRRMCVWMNRDRQSWRWMERWFPKDRIWAWWRIFPKKLWGSRTWWEDFVSHYDDCRRPRREALL